jgi:hypothetical protein
MTDAERWFRERYSVTPERRSTFMTRRWRCRPRRRRIDALGGMVEAVKSGFPQREIAEAAYELNRH